MNLEDLRCKRRRAPRLGLAGLEEISLAPGLQRALDTALADNHGSPAWRRRKGYEARDLLALSVLATERMIVLQLDLSESLRALIHLRTPVPTRPSGQQELVIEHTALLGLTYRQEALLFPQPGASFIEILQPDDVFLAQVPTRPPYCLCLAPVLPAGIPCRELILMSYAALTLQTFQIDARDAAGVFHDAAARWWQENTGRIPLTRKPFLRSPREARP